MNNQQVGWVIAAIIIGAIIIASMVSKAAKAEVETQFPVSIPPTPQQVVQDQNQQDALECMAAGHTWTGYSCDWYVTP